MEETTTQSTQAPKLPSEVSLALLSASTFEAMEGFLQEAGLSDPDVSALSAATYMLASGDISASAYLEQIMEVYQLTHVQAQTIAVHIVTDVLKRYEHALPTPLAPMLEAFEKDLPFAIDEMTRDPSTVLTTIGRDDTTVKDGVKQEDDTKLDDELEDIKQQKADILEKTDPLDIPGIVKEICENPTFQFTDATLMDRCVKLIESRVRDVRTPEQTRAQLEKAVERGGLGVSGRRLADILALIEGRVSAFQGNLSQEEQRKRIDQRAGALDKTQLAKNEETLLTKRYVELTGKVPSTHIAPAAPSVSRTSVAISAHHEQLAREGKIDTAKVKEAVEGAKQTTAQPRPKATPSMQEVTFEKRLSGPIDELRSLTLADFRRLSKDPVQAATKVKDKVDLMEEQGYDRLVEAIQAWRSSALNQMYVGLTREAVLTGTSVSELLSRKRIAVEETLSDEELKAIMKLNAELRF